MALNGNTLGTNIKNAVSVYIAGLLSYGASMGSHFNQLSFWQVIGGEIVSHIVTAGVVGVTTSCNLTGGQLSDAISAAYGDSHIAGTGWGVLT